MQVINGLLAAMSNKAVHFFHLNVVLRAYTNPGQEFLSCTKICLQFQRFITAGLFLLSLTVSCTSSKPFSQQLYNCQPADTIIKAGSIRYKIEIIGETKKGCKIKTQFLNNPNPGFEGKQTRPIIKELSLWSNRKSLYTGNTTKLLSGTGCFIYKSISLFMLR